MPAQGAPATSQSGNDHAAVAGLVARPMLRALRAVVTVHLLGVFAQPVLAGRFLAGDYDMLATHGNLGMVATVVGIAQLVTAVVYWRPAGGPAWPALAGLGIVIAEATQISLGFGQVTGLHVPLGVVIAAAAALLAVWAWLPGAAQRRRTAEPA